jgi:DNA polymerase-3 subunit alpha
MKTYDEYPLDVLIEKEKTAMGFNLSMTPVSVYEDIIQKYQLTPLGSIENTTRTLGMIKRLKVIQTKQGKSMAFIEVSDGDTNLDVTVFPEVYAKYGSLLSNKSLMILTIEPNQYEGKKYILNRIEVIPDETTQTELQ